MSALLGRIPSAVGYQPTLATDMGTMQERITTTKKGSITSVQVHHLNPIDLQNTTLASLYDLQCWHDIETVWFLFRLSMCLLMT